MKKALSSDYNIISRHIMAGVWCPFRKNLYNNKVVWSTSVHPFYNTVLENLTIRATPSVILHVHVASLTDQTCTTVRLYIAVRMN